MAIKFRAGMEPGDTVLVNGATGFTGRLAVQLARYYGAGKIIATGRNARSLDELMTLGADQVLSLHQTDAEITDQLTQIHRATPINVIIDYLWGHTAELILTSIKGKGAVTPRTRFVSVGAMTGNTIQLSSAILRSIDLQLSGSGLGSWTERQMEVLFSEILPEMFRLAADGKLKIATVPVALTDIEKVWDLEVSDGKRLVIQI
jgi:NADPH:quinone reductase-like Zn-dependent oxidoreductase